MPRASRKISERGIYHVMIRGNNKNKIFYDDKDRYKFLISMKEVKEISEFKIFAYCLMNNHIHLLIKEEGENLGEIIKRILVRYSGYFNKKYDRMGHLTQGRFKSKAVETEQYFLTVLRYIHRNPVVAGLTDLPIEYKWSSYNAYICNYRNENVKSEIDTLFVRGYFKDVNIFEQFILTDENDVCMDVKENTLNVILSAFEKDSSGKCIIDDEKDREKLKVICESKVFSIRELSEVLGLSRYNIIKFTKGDSPHRQIKKPGFFMNFLLTKNKVSVIMFE